MLHVTDSLFFIAIVALIIGEHENEVPQISASVLGRKICKDCPWTGYL